MVLTVINEDVEPVIEQVFEFEVHEHGYVYQQVGDGLFDEMTTEIIVHEDDDDADITHVTVRTWYTFGGIFAGVKDWLAAGTRREEMQLLLFNLAHDLDRDRETEEQVAE